MTDDVTENVASPFCVVTVAGRLFPFTWVLVSPEFNEIVSVSDTGAKFLLQSFISTTSGMVPFVVVIGGLG